MSYKFLFFLLLIFLFSFTTSNKTPTFNLKSSSYKTLMCINGYFEFQLLGTIKETCSETKFELPLEIPENSIAKCKLLQTNVATSGTETSAEIDCKIDSFVYNLDQTNIKLPESINIKDNSVIFSTTNSNIQNGIIIEKYTCDPIFENGFINYNIIELSFDLDKCEIKNNLAFELIGKLNSTTNDMQFYLYFNNPKNGIAYCDLEVIDNIGKNATSFCNLISYDNVDSKNLEIYDQKTRDIDDENVILNIVMNDNGVKDCYGSFGSINLNIIALYIIFLILF